MEYYLLDILDARRQPHVYQQRLFIVGPWPNYESEAELVAYLEFSNRRFPQDGSMICSQIFTSSIRPRRIIWQKNTLRPPFQAPTEQRYNPVDPLPTTNTLFFHGIPRYSLRRRIDPVTRGYRPFCTISRSFYSLGEGMWRCPTHLEEIPVDVFRRFRNDYRTER